MMKVWTAFLLIGAAASVVAWAVALCHETRVLDETVGVAGEINAFAAVARRKGGDRWLGAITNWEKREIELSTDFLKSGEWNVEAFEDAPDADVNAEHYVRRKFTIKAGENLKLSLAPGGGFAACLTPVAVAK